LRATQETQFLTLREKRKKSWGTIKGRFHNLGDRAKSSKSPQKASRKVRNGNKGGLLWPWEEKFFRPEEYIANIQKPSKVKTIRSECVGEDFFEAI